jgi:hypothetical protein
VQENIHLIRRNKGSIHIAKPMFCFRLGPGTQRRGRNEHEMCERVAKGKKFDDETTIYIYIYIYMYMFFYRTMLNTILHTYVSKTEHHQVPHIYLLIFFIVMQGSCEPIYFGWRVEASVEIIIESKIWFNWLIRLTDCGTS